jgi:hypothetical protein
MFIKQIIKGEKIVVNIPLVNGSGKTRIKTRPILNDYGVPFSTRSEKFNSSCYVEWQISYDAVVADLEKLELTSLKDIQFVGANGKTKALYELSEYMKYFYDWNIIFKKQLTEIKDYLSALTENNFLDKHPELKILRQQFEPKSINGTDYLFTRVMYPLLVHKFGNFEIITEIIITERQYARGTQPMLYLCFPLNELDNGKDLIGRTAELKEFSTFTISRNNISIFIEMLKIFGTLSANHNHDILEIIEAILK